MSVMAFSKRRRAFEKAPLEISENLFRVPKEHSFFLFGPPV